MSPGTRIEKCLSWFQPQNVSSVVPQSNPISSTEVIEYMHIPVLTIIIFLPDTVGIGQVPSKLGSVHDSISWPQLKAIAF